MNYLAIDPGVTDGCACVYAEGHSCPEITAAWFERLETFAPTDAIDTLAVVQRPDPGDRIHLVIVERPQFDGRSGAARPIDLMNLAWVGSGVANRFAGRDGAAIVEYSPRDWKGSEAKPLMHRRLWNALTPAEREILGGAATEAMILMACRKGGLDRWGQPGHTYYSQAKAARVGGGRGGFIHNLLDAAALLAVHVGRLKRAG